jgi:histidinol-phosphatase (PHP family)
MVSTACPDIVGHLDLIKKCSISPRGEPLFCESEEWYHREVMECLDAIAASRAVLEVNTGAVAKGTTAEAYPSQWIVEACREREIPLMINADAHRPDQLTAGHDVGVRMLVGAGYDHTMLLTPEGWQPESIASE